MVIYLNNANCDTYPIMAGEHEMIGAEGAIPERIFGSDDIDIINDGVPYGSEVMGVTDVDELNKHGDA